VFFVVRIVVCGSLDFTREIGKIRKSLLKMGFEVVVPKTSRDVLDGELSLERVLAEKQSGEIVGRAREVDPLNYYYREIMDSDCVLVLNLDKDGVEGYVGGNTLIEMGFAYVLDKEIYLWKDVPDMGYTDEILLMEPEVLGGDLSKLKKEVGDEVGEG